MTLNEWERRLLQSLSGLSKEEQQTAIDYYREMYGDKLEAGYEPEKIVEEFGLPEDCAQKILSGVESAQPFFSYSTTTPTAKTSSYSVGSIVGLVFMTLFVTIPVYAVILSVALAFASCVLAGGACVIGGAFYTVFSPFYLGLNGTSFGGVLANMGIAIATAGIGFLLMIAFYFLTKYVVVAGVKLFKIIYGRWER